MIIKQIKPISYRSAGFSMIDVLVAIVVLATALLALAALQGALTRNSADSRARSQIAAFSDGLIDQLRSSGYNTITAGSTKITASSGGTAIQRTELNKAQAAAGVSNLTTTITSTTYYGSGSTFTITPAVNVPEYKQINVNNTWTDATGQSRTLQLDTIVDSVQINQTDQTLINKQLSITGAGAPIVRQYNPGATAGVIPIAIGNGSDTAATNPAPEIMSKGKNSQVVGTTFRVLTYQAPDADQQTIIQQQVDTRVISCTCSFGSGVTDTSNVFAQPYRPTYWDGTKYISPVATAAHFSSTGEDTNVTPQDLYCDICCRDRNDPAAAGDDQTPFDSFSTDTKKYRYDTTTNQLVEATSGDYLNACRLIRVDGQYRVATDMRNYFFGLLATDTAANAKVPIGSTSTNPSSSPVPDSHSTNCGGTDYTTCYKGFVTNFLSATSTYSSLIGAGTPSTVWTTLNTAAATLYGADGLNTPTNINITYNSTTPDYRYMHARGLYIDHLETAAVGAINKAIGACPSTSTTADCVLPLLPFTTINVTELADWNVTALVAAHPLFNTDLTVSGQAIIGGDPTNPLRGVVNVTSASAVSGDTPTSVATISASNSGVAVADPVDPDDAAVAFTLTDAQQFTISNGTSTSGFPFGVTLDPGNTVLSQLTDASKTDDPSVSWQIGTASSVPCSPNYTKHGSKYTLDSHSCTVSTSTTPPVSLSVVVQGYNQSSTTSQVVSGCGTATQTVTVCSNYAVDPTKISVRGSLVSGITPSLFCNSGTGAASCDGAISEGSIITIPSPPAVGVATTSPGDAISIGFTLQGSSVATGTCSSNVITTCNPAGNNCTTSTSYTYLAGTCTP